MKWWRRWWRWFTLTDAPTMQVTMSSAAVCDVEGCKEKATLFLSVNTNHVTKNSQRCKAHDNLPRLMQP